MSGAVLAAGALVVAAVLVGRPQRVRHRMRSVRPAPMRIWTRLRSGIADLKERRLLIVGAVVGVSAGAVLGGPVAAVLCGGYVAAATRAVLQRRNMRRNRDIGRACADAITGLADDLRAGRTIPDAFSGAVNDVAPVVDEVTRAELHDLVAATRRASDVPGALRRVRHPVLAPVFGRLATVWALSDTGAPLASLLDRLDGELRSRRRGAEQAAAQLAASTTTARLLAALPLFGLILGPALGVDPTEQLLHTPIGGACAVLAMALQFGGFAWSSKLGRGALR